MFYQNNNDYMRDAFYYSAPQSSTYQSVGMSGFAPMNNMSGNMPMYSTGGMSANSMGNSMMNNQMMNPMMAPQQNVQRTSVATMYPQIYRIINPVASRVVTSSNVQFLSEDTLNNMVDTVFNIVEGDISSLASSNPSNSSDDTVTQGPSRSGSSNNSSNSSGSSRQSTSVETRSTTTTVVAQRNRGENQLLRDLIKIIIIKDIISRQTSFAMEGPANNQMNARMNSGTSFAGNANSFYDPRMYGMA